MPARLIEVELRVADIDASARFYREVVGVPVERQDPHEPEWEPHYALSWGRWARGADFALFLIYPAREDAPSGSSRIAFMVDLVDEVHARAEDAGVRVVEAPGRRPWGRGATYEDPDGNLVSVIEPS